MTVQSPAARATPGKATTSDLLGFPATLRRHRRAPTTIRNYAGTIRLFDLWCRERGRQANSATTEDLLDYAATLPFTYASQQRLINAYKAFWRLYLRRPEPCPAIAVRCPTKPRMRYRGLEPEAARALVLAARSQGNKHYAVCCLLYYAGLRNEEAAAFTYTEDQGDWLAVVGKGAQSGVLPVHPVLRAALDALGPRNGSPYMFPGRRQGTHISTNTVNIWVRLAAASAGLGHVTPHQLRYTYGGVMHDESDNLRAVNELLRHSKSSLSVTAGYTRTKVAKMVELISLL